MNWTAGARVANADWWRPSREFNFRSCNRRAVVAGKAELRRGRNERSQRGRWESERVVLTRDFLC